MLNVKETEDRSVSDLGRRKEEGGKRKEAGGRRQDSRRQEAGGWR